MFSATVRRPWSLAESYAAAAPSAKEVPIIVNLSVCGTTRKTEHKRISDIFETPGRMCVDGPEDRGSIAEYGSPDRMPVLSRKERTLPMRSLPAAFAVFRIPPPAESFASRPLIFNRRTSAADVCLLLKVRPITPELRPECSLIVAPAPFSCPRTDDHRTRILQPGYPVWENCVTFSQTLTKRWGSQRCETRLKTNNRRKGHLAFRVTIHCAPTGCLLLNVI